MQEMTVICMYKYRRNSKLNSRNSNNLKITIVRNPEKSEPRITLMYDLDHCHLPTTEKTPAKWLLVQIHEVHPGWYDKIRTVTVRRYKRRRTK